jgi:hypothetical protein
MFIFADAQAVDLDTGGRKVLRVFKNPPGGWRDEPQRLPSPFRAKETVDQGVAANHTGHVFVVHKSNEVFIYDKLGSYVTSFAVNNSLNIRATCICVDKERQRIYVGVRNAPVQVWEY